METYHALQCDEVVELLTDHADNETWVDPNERPAWDLHEAVDCPQRIGMISLHLITILLNVFNCQRFSFCPAQPMDNHLKWLMRSIAQSSVLQVVTPRRAVVFFNPTLKST